MAKTETKQRRTRVFQKKTLCMLMAGAFAGGLAHAGQFSLDNGVEGTWGLNMSLGTSIRANNADKDLIMRGNGGNAGSSHDDGNLNFDKGDTFSTQAKVVGELGLKKDEFGAFFRVKGWYDYQLEDKGVPFGSSANGYQANGRLDDSEFHKLSKFSGLEMLDAYASWNSYIGDHPVTVKFGNQVVNWGESLFIPGINQYGAFDISAARRPGAQVKEILLPIPQIWANFGLTENLTLEGFLQLEHKRNVLDGCGTYWSISDVYNCSDQGVTIGAGAFGVLFNDRQGFNNGIVGAPAGSTNLILSNAGDQVASDSGQWGLAARYFSQELSTEFGAYYVNYHQRSPVISVLFDRSTTPGSAFNNIPSFQFQYAWDWTAEDIQVLGLSASTNLGGWSMFGELSHSMDVPVQINGVDLLRGITNGAGPLVQDPEFQHALANRNQGILLHGYDRKDKTQIQLSTLKSFPRILGAESVSLIGEIGFQHWSGIGNPWTDRRYGRGFVYGQAISSAPGQTGGGGVGASTCAGAGGTGATGTTSDGSYCEAEGFATTSAWGYRVQVEGSYPNVFAGVNVKPRVFWSHDVKGYSADSTFVEDRMVLGLGARFDYLNMYYADISYNMFNRKAKYDTFHDRDFISLAVGVNF